jgi:hypothetical protein
VDYDNSYSHTGTFVRCKICDGKAFFKRAFKHNQLCKTCAREMNRQARWARWDANPELIQRYPNIYELIEYFQSRCPHLAAELLGVDNDPYCVNYAVYRGEHDEE